MRIKILRDILVDGHVPAGTVDDFDDKIARALIHEQAAVEATEEEVTTPSTIIVNAAAERKKKIK